MSKFASHVSYTRSVWVLGVAAFNEQEILIFLLRERRRNSPLFQAFLEVKKLKGRRSVDVATPKTQTLRV